MLGARIKTLQTYYYTKNAPTYDSYTYKYEKIAFIIAKTQIMSTQTQAGAVWY